MHTYREGGLNLTVLQCSSKYHELQNKAKMQCSWQALLLTAIIQCSHTSEANFLLVISPQFILSRQNHSSQSDLSSVNQFFVSRKTPLGPWGAGFMLVISFIARQTFLRKSPGILTLVDQIRPSQRMLRTHKYHKTHTRLTLLIKGYVRPVLMLDTPQNVCVHSY